MNNPPKKRGGARPNSGPQKGAKYKKTLDAEARLLALRDLVSKELEPMTQAQIAHAKGVHYMVLRHKDGTFTRATDEKQIDAAIASGAMAFQIFTQAPNTGAFSDLLNRTFGKPAEQPQQVKHSGHLTFSWKKSQK